MYNLVVNKNIETHGEENEKQIPVIKIPPDVEWKPIVEDFVRKSGHVCMFRTIDPKGKSTYAIIAKGTDRDNFSQVHRPEQLEAMRDLGLHPSDFTHLFPDLRFSLERGQYLLVYDETLIKGVPNGPHMYVPKDGSSFKEALLAIFVQE
jgi:hypothetical protein